MTITHKITTALVKGVPQGTIIANPQVLTPDVKDEREALKCLSRNPQAKLESRMVDLLSEVNSLSQVYGSQSNNKNSKYEYLSHEE